jgi:hypothetical protein
MASIVKNTTSFRPATFGRFSVPFGRTSSCDGEVIWAYIQRRDSIRAWSVILSVYGADPFAEVKLFSILHFTICCRLVFKNLLFHLDWQKIVKNRQNFPSIKLL